MGQKITVVDYGMGNINSLLKLLNNKNTIAVVSSNPEIIYNSDKIILPGVGHFKKAMENLGKLNLLEVLQKINIQKKMPVLGICLGMQIMANKSDEGNVGGLSWIDADVVKFSIKNKVRYKVPQIGWNQVSISKNSRLMKDIPDLSEFYFVHSYHCVCNNTADILNETEYEYRFTSAVEKDNIFGVQYHPEKSHDVGAQVLKNFVNL